MKKTLLLVLCLLMTLTLFANGGGEGSGSGKDGVVLSEPGQFPIVKEGDLTMKVFAGQRPSTDSYLREDNSFTAYFEDLTGVKFEFVSPADVDQEQKTQLNLMLASGTVPGIIFKSAQTLLSFGEQILYAQQGVLLPLGDLYDENAYYAKEVLADQPHLITDITLPDGNWYGMPDIGTCVHCEHTRKLWVNMVWLDKLGLDFPETTQDFYDMLVAFKTQDPNGNGKADEIPLAGAATGWDTQVDVFIMNAFAPNDGSGNDKLYIMDGKITPSYTTDGWKEGLMFMNKLYEEGLMAAESFTQDSKQLQALGENPGDMILGAAPGGYQGTYSTLYGDSGRWLDYKSMPPLRGPSGAQYTGYKALTPSTGAFITNNSENPAAAMKVLDSFYEIDLYLRSQLGEEGVAWRKPVAGENGLDRKTPANRVQIMAVQERENDSWRQIAPEAFKNFHSLSFFDEAEKPLEFMLYDATVDTFYPYRQNDMDIYPPTWIFTEEQAADVVDLGTGIKDYVKLMVAQFVTGAVDIESGWQEYLDELETYGLSDYVAVHQAAYDATK